VARAERLRTLLGEISSGDAGEKSAEAVVVKIDAERQKERRAEGLRDRLSKRLFEISKVSGKVTTRNPEWILQRARAV